MDYPAQSTLEPSLQLRDGAAATCRGCQSRSERDKPGGTSGGEEILEKTSLKEKDLLLQTQNPEDVFRSQF